MGLPEKAPLAEWEQAVVMAAVVKRLGGEVVIPYSEIVALEETVVTVVDERDAIRIRIRPKKPPLGVWEP